jgi:WD40 repeat protein
MNNLRKNCILPFSLVFGFLLFLTAACGIQPSGLTMSLAASTPPGTTLLTYHDTDSVRDAVWSPDGKQIASLNFSNVLKIWDTTSGKTLWQSTITNGFSLAWSHTGKYIAVGNFVNTSPTQVTAGIVKILDARTGTVQRTLLEDGSINTIAWSANDQRIVAGTDGGALHIWDSSTGKTEAIFHQHAGPISALAWSHNGKYIAFAAYDSGHNLVYVYDIQSGEVHPFYYGGHTQKITSLSWSNDDQYIASSSQDKTVQVWNALTFKKRLTLTDFTAPVTHVAYSHDGKQLAVTSSDATSRIYDANTGKLVLKYTGQHAFVSDAQWSPNDQRIASASSDFTVKIWQAR